MVENTRKALRPGALKPVNLPETASVEEDAAGLPTAIKLKKRETIIAILDRWRIDDEWWREKPLSRLYYEVVLNSGQRLVVFKSLTENRWYLQKY